MKLTNKEKEYFASLGETERNIAQIEETMKENITIYTFSLNPGFDSKRITRDEALRLLGREKYLSGIRRSAFHRTAARYVADDDRDGTVFFDSRKLWR